MAKLETQTVKETKAKKRKHNNLENEDEVANKSLIVEGLIGQDEPMQTNSSTEIVSVVSTKKSKKRKNKENNVIEGKRSKSQDKAENEHKVVEPEVEDFHEPTPEELKESEKSENRLTIVTGRQKKQQKHQQFLEAQKNQSTERMKQRNEEYLKKWKHARNSWKFEKLRQISIQQTIFDSDKIDTKIWPIALEYLANGKGSAKDKIVKLANNVIDEVDKLCEEKESEEERQLILNSVKYQRARNLLQIFD